MTKKNNNNYAPHLPEAEINQLVRELSSSKLSPVSLYPAHEQELASKVAGIVNELMSEYNHKVVQIIEQERKVAFQAGVKEGKKLVKKS